MSGRTFDRLAKVYGMVERVRAAELAMASGLVAEAVSARVGEEAGWRESASLLRTSIGGGDAGGRVLGEAACCLSAERVVRLRGLQRTREEAQDTAMQRYRATRMQRQQMEGEAARLRAEEALEAGRREQGAADDRYGARMKRG